MRSKSSSPAPLRDESSAQSVSADRPRYLRVSHGSNLRDAAIGSRASTPGAKRAHSPELDSANFRAARDLLQARLDAGLTQEQLAALSGEDPKTIGQRERGRVDLGALRQLVLIERVKRAKESK